MTNKHLGDKVIPKKEPPREEPEKWIPLENHPDYLRSTKTGAIKHKNH